MGGNDGNGSQRVSRQARIALICLVVALVLSFGFNIYQWVAEGNAITKWTEQAIKLELDNAKLQKERDALVIDVDTLKEAQEAAEAKALAKDETIASLEKVVEEAGEPPPAARKYTRPRDEVNKAKTKQINLLKAGLAACKETVAAQDNAREKGLEIEDNFEEQAEGHKANTKRVVRKYRTKIAFTVIGTAAVMGTAGYMIGRATK